ncbi:TolC family protein [Candidatus Thioglobus autotrophicus]|uniref:TolC family protein n=1 Tax=Candidatus Thioglobus autotrophicus TaxID=1705394 RepID=UPI00299DECBA|nr:TolC family protein [Candidatus Thioglobus autotrophicus]WPE16882.1 TolC family protein [Candidatus Thioglobus autotrophicus]
MKFLSFLLIFASGFSYSESLPNPLTLGHILKLTSEYNFAEKQQLLNIDAEQHRLSDWKNQYDTTAKVDLQLAKRSNYDSAINNSHAFIYLKKTLYNQAIEIGKNAQLDTINEENLSLQQLQQDKSIRLMRSFFDIILADLSYETALQKLAISAIREGRVQDDYDIQSASEVALLEKQVDTQISQIHRIRAESKQIQTRAKLAQLLNISYEDRPDDVVMPNYKSLFKKELAEFSYYQKKLTDNLKLKQLKQSLSAIGRQISQQKDNLGVVINSSARVGEQGYQREKNGQWRAGIQLSMPFGTDAKQDSEISQLMIQSKKKQLEIEQLQQDLLGEALDHHLNLSALRQIHKALIVELDYRDLHLEKARASYEMEIKSDIGNAMANYTDSERKLAENEFNYVITLKKLHHLIGEDYEI